MKQILWAAATLFAGHTSAQSVDKCTISGNITGLSSGKAYFVIRGANSQKTDSCNIVDGKFYFKDTVSLKKIGTVFVVDSGGQTGRTSVIVEKGKINVTGSSNNLSSITVGGTHDNNLVALYNRKLFEGIPNWLNDFKAKYEVARNNRDTAEMDRLDKEYGFMSQKNTALALSIIRDNKNTLAAPLLLSMQINALSVTQLDSVLTQIEAATPVSYDIVAQLRDFVNKKLRISVGKDAPDIVQKDTSGTKDIQLSSLKGKYVLLDFWASWCKYCTAEHPNVVAAYEKYKDKNFTIFSVSLDNNREKWKSAIQSDKLSWSYHVSDLAGWQNAAAKQYAVQSIPSNFLIDPNGKIIAVNLKGPALDEKLAEVLK